MKTYFILGFLLISQSSFSQTILGKWTTIDDETGNKKAVVEIFEVQGKLFGRIIEILEADKKRQRCTISLEGKDKLIVRGYLGISLFGRSQTWVRQK